MKMLVSAVAGCAVSVLILICAARGIHIAEHGLETTDYDLEHGRSIFSSRCARCHIITGNSADVGPNLSQIGLMASQRKPGLSGPAYILESILKPREFKSPGSNGEMPVNLVNSYADDEILHLVAFLCSRGGIVADEEIQSLTIERPPVEVISRNYDASQVLNGESLFRQKGGCADCHPFYGGQSNELLAPYLFYRGYRDRDELKRAIIAPHDKVAPGYRQSTIVLQNGQTRTGQLIGRDDSSISLLSRSNGRASLTEVPCSDIELDDTGELSVEHTAVSAMPTGYQVLLTAEELDDLLVFILSMN